MAEAKDKGKLAKKAVDFGPGKEASHCGNCTHFIEGADEFGDATCSIVAGTVRWHNWCNRWAKGDSHVDGPFEGTMTSS